MAPADAADGAVRLLRLQHGEQLEASYLQLERGTRLRLAAGASLLGRHVYVYTNYVIDDDSEARDGDGGVPFSRSRYYALQWRRAPVGERPGAAEPPALGTGVLVDSTDLYAELTLARPGVYRYYFVYDTASAAGGAAGDGAAGADGAAGSGWLQVPPRLAAPLDGLSLQTVLAKSLGPLARWEAALRPARQAGYSGVHVSPVQARGASRSAYCLAEHARLDPALQGDLADLDALLSRLRREWGMVFVSDIVLNHAANEAELLQREPAASYNAANCPWLRPAALLDAALGHASAAVARGEWEALGVPRAPCTAEHAAAARAALRSVVLPALRLPELWQCDAPRVLQAYRAAALHRVHRTGASDDSEEQLVLIPDPQWRRLHASIDMELALRLYHRADESGARGEAALAARLAVLQAAVAHEVDAHLDAALDNLTQTIMYERVAGDGPRLGAVSERAPLFPRYFTQPLDPAEATLAELEAAVWGPRAPGVMAHNGWLMGGDPLEDFADARAGGRVYLRRELVAWGDSVKLRYGAAPEDSPALWRYMRDYVERSAELFDGVRLDNAHCTPVHVAEYMLDAARAVNPELYVLAELFTDSPHVDALLATRLGITQLVRESLSAWSPRELGRLLHRWSGRPVGDLPPAEWPAPLLPRLPPALLYDATHDNDSPHTKRSVFHAVAGAALTAALCGGSGSTRAVDDLVPHHLNVVDDERLHVTQEDALPEGYLGAAAGLTAARRELNLLHRQLAEEGFTETFVDQMDEEVIAVTRHNPRTREAVVFVVYCAFAPPAPAAGARELPALRLPCEVAEVLLEADVVHRDYPASGRPFEGWAQFARHPAFITGLPQYTVRLQRRLPPARAAAWRADAADACTWRAAGALPGSVAVLRLRAAPAPAPPPAAELEAALRLLAAEELNALLYRCEAEERDAAGTGVYVVPGAGPLVYAGLAGTQAMLEEMDLSHPLAANLRAGDWLAEYTVARAAAAGGALARVAAAMRAALEPLRREPRYLQPASFMRVHSALHRAAASEALRRVAPPASSAAADLALTSFQLWGRVPSAALPGAGGGSLSAGLPHFAAGYMRCWGRDTFIALRGLLLLPGRWAEARAALLAGAALLRRGLVPNLLAHPPRYNCRDAVWWWLYSLQHYCEEAPEGYAVLAAAVARAAPAPPAAAPAPPADAPAELPLHDLVLEVFEQHLQGIEFREERAGREIDEHMSDAGFNVRAGVDPDTGFVFGGNDSNAGTWMDKMGSSDAAGTRGRPATPRDGSAIELVALCHSAVRWLARAHRAGRFPHAGAARTHRDGSRSAWPWPRWAERIEASFERHFWIPAAPSAADARPDLVHRRAIYKDTVGATRAYADYQLRPNQVVAMAVSPELFDARHAWRALAAVREHLLTPLGLRTLDPADWAYRPHYDPAAEGDAATAHGYNYHQGPAWTWLLGAYVRARLAFAQANGEYARAVAEGYAALAPAAAALRAEPWRGLPELTHGDGAPCAASCRTQAWSDAAALEALHALAEARRARPLPRA